MQITLKEITDNWGVLFTPIVGGVTWYFTKLSSKKRAKLDLETKLFERLDLVSDKYVEIHAKYHGVQEHLVDLKSQNIELHKSVIELTKQNERLQLMIENLTKENALLQKSVSEFSLKNEEVTKELHLIKEQYYKSN